MTTEEMIEDLVYIREKHTHPDGYYWESIDRAIALIHAAEELASDTTAMIKMLKKLMELSGVDFIINVNDQEMRADITKEVEATLEAYRAAGGAK